MNKMTSSLSLPVSPSTSSTTIQLIRKKQLKKKRRKIRKPFRMLSAVLQEDLRKLSLISRILQMLRMEPRGPKALHSIRSLTPSPTLRPFQ